MLFVLQWLSSVVALQTSIACHLAAKRKRKEEEASLRLKEEVTSDGEDAEPVLNGDKKPSEEKMAEEPSKNLVNGRGSPVSKMPKLG